MWDNGCPPGLGPGSIEKCTFDSCHPDKGNSYLTINTDIKIEDLFDMVNEKQRFE